MSPTASPRNPDRPAHVERPIPTYNGFVMLAIGLVLLATAAWQVVSLVGTGRPSLAGIAMIVLTVLVAVLVLAGLYTLQPNEAAILQLFGAYRGTSRVPGLRGTNPFYTRRKLSLRARNLNGERLKVNDKRGNPIEIAAVVVWRVEDTAKAAFEAGQSFVAAIGDATSTTNAQLREAFDAAPQCQAD